MAKINRVNAPRSEEVEEQEEEIVDTGVKIDDHLMALAQRIQSAETRIEAGDLAMLELSSQIDELSKKIDRLMIRLDEEKDLRVNAHSNVIADMDHQSLSLRILDICFNKYLESEANAFERLADDPSIAKFGMRHLIKAHRNLVNGLEHALRMS